MADGGESGCAGAGGVGKGGLLAALQAEGLRRGEEVVFADEMRLGLLGQVRRVWGRRGEKQRWRIELRYEWVYLVLYHF
jgi:ATPase subunit of ABC transporter with duplicated ATPase domains